MGEKKAKILQIKYNVVKKKLENFICRVSFEGMVQE